MRLFLAIELPEAVRRPLADLCARWKQSGIVRALSISWVRRENLHVTLKFLGETAEPRLPRLCDALQTVSAPAIRLRPDHVDCLPPRGPVRVIGVGLAGDLEAIHEIFEQIQRATEPLGFARERRRYRPHVTLARVRQPLPPRDRPALAEAGAPELPAPEFTAGEFVLMQSHLHPHGAQYVPLARFPLRGPCRSGEGSAGVD